MTSLVVGVMKSSWESAQRLGHQLDTCGCIGDKDNVKVGRTSIEPLQDAEPRILNEDTRQLG
jgi:hypothetical protein